MFLQLLLVETFIKVSSLLGRALLGLLKKPCFTNWKPDLEVPLEIVWMLNYVMVMWLSMLLFPHITLMTPFLLLLLFLAYYSFLVLVAQKPFSNSTKDYTSLNIAVFANI
jgi:Ca2+/Na+ antiporter